MDSWSHIGCLSRWQIGASLSGISGSDTGEIKYSEQGVNQKLLSCSDRVQGYGW